MYDRERLDTAFLEENSELIEDKFENQEDFDDLKAKI